MSESILHYHFKAVTAMILLQIRRQWRLQEACRPMPSENLDATSAEPVFAENGMSTGGLWGFMPAQSDPLLIDLVPKMDQVLFSAPER